MAELIIAAAGLVLGTWWVATWHVRRAGARAAVAPVTRRVDESVAPAPRLGVVVNLNDHDHDREHEARVTDIAAVVREGLLELRNAELRLILDTVDQGFVTLQPDGQLLQTRSAILTRWTGELPERAFLWDLVGCLDPAARAWTRLAWGQLADGYLPLPVALAQLPKRLKRDEQCWDIAYYPVSKGETLERIVAVLTDVTGELERQRSRTEQHDFAALVERLVGFRRGFFEFWSEATALVARVSDASAIDEALRRDLHTLKGNTRSVGLLGLAELCHELEDTAQQRDQYCLDVSERTRMQGAWDTLSQRMQPLLQGAQGTVECTEDDLARLAKAVSARAPHRELEELLAQLRVPSITSRLAAAKQHLLEVCRRLNKSSPQIILEDDGLRSSPRHLAPFWSAFVHVLNNTADHGIEPDDARLNVGKPVPARIKICVRQSAASLVVEVTDDGPGIDWPRVEARARERGLPHQTHEDLVVALFADAFSLRDVVSEFSGRGVGLAAVKNVVSELRGTIEIDSQVGRGTTIRCLLPLEPVLKPGPSPAKRREQA